MKQLLTLLRSWWNYRFTDWANGWECNALHPKPSDDRKILYGCCRFKGHYGAHRDYRGNRWLR